MDEETDDIVTKIEKIAEDLGLNIAEAIIRGTVGGISQGIPLNEEQKGYLKELLIEFNKLEDELDPKIAERVVSEDYSKPLEDFTIYAYYASTPESERSDKRIQDYMQSSEIKRLEESHEFAYRSHLALEEIMSTDYFANPAEHPVLNKEKYVNAYKLYVDGKFKEALDLLIPVLLFIDKSTFSVPHNLTSAYAPVLVVRKHVKYLCKAIKTVEQVFQEIHEKSDEDIRENGPQRIAEYTVPKYLMPLAKNVANDLMTPNNKLIC